MSEAGEIPWFKIGDAPGLRFLKEQISGLDALKPYLPRASVLDLGCAEGSIAKYYVDTLGVDIAHGIEILKQRVDVARKQCAGYMGVQFWAGDLDNLPELDKLEGLLPKYDIVLTLAVLHKLARPIEALKWAAARAGKVIAVRMPGPDLVFVARGSKAVRVEPQRILADEFDLIGKQIGPRSEMTLTFKRR